MGKTLCIGKHICFSDASHKKFVHLSPLKLADKPFNENGLKSKARKPGTLNNHVLNSETEPRIKPETVKKRVCGRYHPHSMRIDQYSFLAVITFAT